MTSTTLRFPSFFSTGWREHQKQFQKGPKVRSRTDVICQYFKAPTSLYLSLFISLFSLFFFSVLFFMSSIKGAATDPPRKLLQMESFSLATLFPVRVRVWLCVCACVIVCCVCVCVCVCWKSMWPGMPLMTACYLMTAAGLQGYSPVCVKRYCIPALYAFLLCSSTFFCARPYCIPALPHAEKDTKPALFYACIYACISIMLKHFSACISIMLQHFSAYISTMLQHFFLFAFLLCSSTFC